MESFRDKRQISFLNFIQKIAKDNNSQFNIRYKLRDILKDYDEEYLYDGGFIVEPILEAHIKLNG